jgi:hypothetical protein
LNEFAPPRQLNRYPALTHMALSRKTLVIWCAAIVALGISGVWLGAIARDASDIRRWLGLAALVAAISLLIVGSQRDLRLSQREKDAQWRRAKAYGKTRFILTRVLISQLVWLPDLVSAVTTFIQTRSWGRLSAPAPSAYVFAFAAAALTVMWSLFWWHRQERLRS